MRLKRFRPHRHTRDDHPEMDRAWRGTLLVCTTGPDGIEVAERTQPPLRADLRDLFKLDELRKYCTEDELDQPEGETVGKDATNGP